MFRDIVTGKWNLSFSTDQNIAEAAQTFSGKDIDVKLKQHREKRSLDANAYYWCLLTKLAKIHGWSNAEAHNRMFTALIVLLQYFSMNKYSSGTFRFLKIFRNSFMQQ